MTSQAFGTVYQQGLKRTIAFLLSRGVPYDTAPDVAQTAWLRGWERLDQLRDETMIVPWINTIALNSHRRAIRSQSREKEWKPSLTDSVTTALNWAAIDISTILDSCRPSDRDLLEAQLLGNSTKELAEQHGVSQTAIRIRLLRARRSARKFCEPSVASMATAA